MPVPGLRRLFTLVVRPFRGPRAVDLELKAHFEMTIEALERAGASPAEARSEAIRRFGDVDHYREALLRMDRNLTRKALRRDWIGDLRTDVRQLVRGLRQAPAFTFGVAVTLTLGIGTNATMIGLVDQLLLKPPAGVVEPDRVVRYTLTQTYRQFGTFTNSSVTWKEVALMQAEARRVESVAAFALGTASLGRGERARTVPFMTVTTRYFGLLGVKPAFGRFFGPDDDPLDGSAGVAVISYRMWQREYGGRPEAVGRQLILGDRVVAIVGVAPKYFTGIDLDAVDLWLPFHAGARLLAGTSGEWRDTWDWQWIQIVARLAPGVTRVEASAEATALYRAATADHPERKDDQGKVTYQPVMASQGVSEAKEPMVAALLASVSVLLLVLTCANVANLLLARGLARSREIAVRVALGIGRARLIRSLIGEAVVLAGLGAAGGIGLAYLGGTVTRKLLLPNLDFVEPPVDGRLLAVTVVMAGLTALLIGLLPAIRISRPDLTLELRSGGGGQAGGSRRHHRVRRVLLLTQGALSVLLLIGAGLFVRSFARVAAVDFGFRPEHTLVANIDLSEVGYPKEQRLAYFDEARRRLAVMPGVASVSLATASPFANRMSLPVRIPGRDSVPRLPTAGPYFSGVTPEYFATMGIVIRRGRGFTPADGRGAPKVIVVNETLARLYWPEADPIGQCLYIGRAATECRAVVGVMADANSETLDLRKVAAYYVPMEQSGDLNRDRTLFIRTAGDPVSMVQPIRLLLQTMAPNLPVATVRPMTQQMDGLYRPWRMAAALFAVMGLIALAVVLVGLYSVLSYAVAQRLREFGVRAALGATRRDVVSLVVTEGLRVTGIALVVGTAAGMAAGPWLRPLLFETSPWDPVVLAGVAVILGLATGLGSLFPGRRAAAVDPATTLRTD